MFYVFYIISLKIIKIKVINTFRRLWTILNDIFKYMDIKLINNFKLYFFW